MSRLPVIVSFGGYNSAGRSSSHHAYRRMVLDAISAELRQETLADLATMMGLVKHDGESFIADDGSRYTVAELETKFGHQICERTLVRRIESQHFDVDATHWQQKVDLHAEEGQEVTFVVAKKQLPTPVPSDWQLRSLDDDRVRVTLASSLEVKVDSYRDMPVKAAGQLPTGFEPGEQYKSRFHPRALQMAIVGASDAINSLGIDWDTVADTVKPDEVAVYASNAMSQLDEAGLGGMVQSRLKGNRVTTKQCPLGLNTMTADFVNAYVLGSVGATGAITGACASFLYNLRAGIEDITSGRRRVVVVGNSEAPITPEIVDGYGTMSALANDEGLKKLDGVEEADHRRSSRPFGENCGFTIAESSQFVVLMDDALALELGADIHGAVTDVFVNADGFKKSISSPGAGNYITMAKAVASAKALLGEESVQERSFVQAHGSSTPQNRVTESAIFDRVAKAFDITDWPISAVKAYVGHSLAPASADQLITTLGVFKHGIIPGIKTIDKVASDVHQDRLKIQKEDIKREVGSFDVAFLNSKGFGGNNATATVLSSQITEKMLANRYGEEAMVDYELRREKVRAATEDYNQAIIRGENKVIYRFGENMIDESQIEVSDKTIRMPGFKQEIDLPSESPYADLL